jgi:ketosteroid isomerase-like protein
VQLGNREGDLVVIMPSLEADLHAIDALNQQDMKAVLENDVATIISQWTDDFVVIPAAGPIVRGRLANEAIVEAGRQRLQEIEPVDYLASFDEIQVIGNYAYEWGTYRGSMRLRGSEQIVSYSGKLMRILQRQPDGAGKCIVRC